MSEFDHWQPSENNKIDLLLKIFTSEKPFFQKTKWLNSQA